ncbi:MAG: DNA repair exonuclease [Candidatus Nealsonbacteria bacterium]|nr:DNA repair exonuclease [Candidatus Nealsonbacteria bacterium]
MLKFLHTADIHLDSPLRGLQRYEDAPVDEIRLATRRALENLVDLAVEQSVAFVLIAGDLYDGDWRDHHTGLYFVSQMVKLREAEIDVFLIAGNHDAASRITKTLQMPANVTKLSHGKPQTVRLDELGVAIHGQSYAKAAEMEDLSLGYPPTEPGLFNIGILHTSVTGREGHEPYAPCTLDGLRSKQYDYWALGHVHRQETLCDDPPVVFPGNLQGRHIRETGPKGCMLVTVDDEGQVRIEPRPLDVLRWEVCRVDASEAETPEELLDRLRGQLAELVAQSDDRPLAVRVEIDGPCPAHRQIAAEPRRWTSEVRAVAMDVGNLWIEKVKLRTSLPIDLDRVRATEGPIGELLELTAELKANPEALPALLVDDLQKLKKRLPAELTEGPDAIDLDHGDVLGEMLEEVEQMLVRQLHHRETAP